MSINFKKSKYIFKKGPLKKTLKIQLIFSQFQFELVHCRMQQFGLEKNAILIGESIDI